MRERGRGREKRGDREEGRDPGRERGEGVDVSIFLQETTFSELSPAQYGFLTLRDLLKEVGGVEVVVGGNNYPIVKLLTMEEEEEEEKEEERIPAIRYSTPTITAGQVSVVRSPVHLVHHSSCSLQAELLVLLPPATPSSLSLVSPLALASMSASSSLPAV